MTLYDQFINFFVCSRVRSCATTFNGVESFRPRPYHTLIFLSSPLQSGGLTVIRSISMQIELRQTAEKLPSTYFVHVATVLYPVDPLLRQYTL